MNAVATKTTENIAQRIVYCWRTRTPPTPAIRRFGPSVTVVGPAGLATGLGTARGIALGVCVVGVAALVPALAGNLRNAIGPSCVRFTGGARRPPEENRRASRVRSCPTPATGGHPRRDRPLPPRIFRSPSPPAAWPARSSGRASG